MQPPEEIPASSRPYVDFLIIADRVEAINGKLYMMGGAWDSYTSTDLAQPARFGIAVAVNVPWGSTNESHALRLRLDDADGQTSAPPINIEFQVGRPPLLPPGSEQRLVWAINGDFPLPRTGAYSLVASLDGRDERRTVFQVQTAPAPADGR